MRQNRQNDNQNPNFYVYKEGWKMVKNASADLIICRDYHSLLMMLTLFLDSVNSVSHRLLGSLVREMSRLRPSEVSWSWELSVCFLTPTGSGVLRLPGAGMEVLMRLTPTLETLELSLAMLIIWEDILQMGAILTMIFVVF